LAIKNKKGYFFSLTVIIILGLVYIYFSSQSDPGFSKQSQITEQRLQEINRLLTLIEEDSKIGLRVATFRTIMTLDRNVSGGEFIDPTNFDSIVQELILTGLMNGNVQELMENQSIQDWENNTKQLLQNMGAEAQFINSRARVTQETPWQMIATYNTTIEVQDKFTMSNWTKKIITTIHIDITDFYDPLYSKGTNDKRKILKKPDNVDINNLQELVTIGYFVESNNSPSFLQRFQEPNGHNYLRIGIESLINTGASATPPNGHPIIDSVYFNYNNNYDANDICFAQGYMFITGYNETYNVDCVPSPFQVQQP
jgi:hypothetical protein